MFFFLVFVLWMCLKSWSVWFCFCLPHRVGRVQVSGKVFGCIYIYIYTSAFFLKMKSQHNRFETCWETVLNTILKIFPPGDSLPAGIHADTSRVGDKDRNSCCNLGIKTGDLSAAADKKGQKYELSRVVEGGCRIPFGGKVVDASIGAFAKKALCLPLGNSAGVGPDLYFVGDNGMNPSKSDASVPWLVQPVPIAKETDESDKASEKRKKAIDATYEIEYESMEFELYQTTYRYDMPFLVDYGPNKALCGVKAYRTLQEWDHRDQQRRWSQRSRRRATPSLPGGLDFPN